MLDRQKKPEIYVYIKPSTNQGDLSALYHGLEEEGIPFFVKEIESPDVCQLSYEAAQNSPLNVGIGCDGYDLMIHYKNLPKDHPYLVLRRFQAVPQDKLKQFGSNASRLVKGIPLKNPARFMY